MKIHLLRHGKVEGEPALYGSTDVAVSTEIIEQMAQALQCGELSFDEIVSSPLQRCLVLADTLRAERDTPMLTDAGFQEMDFGLYDGQPFDQLKNEWQALEQFWQDPANHPLPGSESIDDFRARVVRSWQQLLQRYSSNESIDRSILLITHGGVIRMLLSHVLGLDCSNPKLFSNLSIANASVTTIDYCVYRHEGSEERVTRVESVALPLQ
ncbi:alpha-ribazole phosphatase family protein [Aliivibrio kagoshimensis]|uniref:alpha-ribazole phosphatase family protein n=1 Tax=Aliivibrio kagoshimensis TaxID=2910230 RepID=UPI003D1288AB